MSKALKIILLLSAACLLIILMLFRNRSPFGKNNTSFASVPENGITRIEMSEGNDRLVLEKSGDKWFMEGGKAIMKPGISNILRILQEMEIKSPVSPELFSSEVTARGVQPVKVRTFEKSRLLSSFLVYRTGSNIYGNIMKKRAGAKPFICYVPGIEGNIGSVFTLNRLYWQPFTIFNYLPSEISAVELENLADTASSFSISSNDGGYVLRNGEHIFHGWDPANLTRYLSYFTYIPFESWALDLGEAEKARITSLLPIFRIRVTPVKGSETMLTLWARDIIRDSAYVTDSDRLYGRTGDSGELFIVRYFDIDPILKKRDYFFK